MVLSLFWKQILPTDESKQQESIKTVAREQDLNHLKLNRTRMGLLAPEVGVQVGVLVVGSR